MSDDTQDGADKPAPKPKKGKNGDQPDAAAAAGDSGPPETSPGGDKPYELASPEDTQRTPGRSYSPGLEEIEGSTVPGNGDGSMLSHVRGPGQAPVDPVAAGLDMTYKGQAEKRMVTQTGEIGAGQRPSTYLEKTGPDKPVQQAAPADGQTVDAPENETK